MQKFGYPKTLIKEFENWVVLLRSEQIRLGSLVLVEKSEAAHLGEVSSESWAEFKQVSEFAENLTREKFGAEKFNYLALMMVDNNVHFHFVPRKNSNTEFNGKIFSDKFGPVTTNLGELDNFTSEDFEKLLTEFKEEK